MTILPDTSPKNRIPGRTLTKTTLPVIFGLFASLFCHPATAEPEPRSFASLEQSLQPDTIIPYKTIGGRKLGLHVFLPEGCKETGSRPAFVSWMT